MTEDQTLTEITTRVLTRNGTACSPRRSPTSCWCTATRRRARRRRSRHFTQQIPVGHVEAGLRTQQSLAAVSRRDEPAAHRRRSHRITLRRPRSRASTCCRRTSTPTTSSSPGNTVIDAFAETASARRPAAAAALERDRSEPAGDRRHRAPPRKPSRTCARSPRRCARSPSCPQRPQLYWPVHPSPRVAPVAHEVLDGVPGVVLVDPIDYAEMVAAVTRSTLHSDRLGRASRGSALPRQAGARDARRDRAARRPGRRNPRARRAPSASGSWRRRAGCSRMPATYARMAQAVNPYGDGRAGRAHRRMAAGAPSRGRLPGALRGVTAGARTSGAVKPLLPVLAAGGTFAATTVAGLLRRSMAGRALQATALGGRPVSSPGWRSAGTPRTGCSSVDVAAMQEDKRGGRSYSDADAAADLAAYLALKRAVSIVVSGERRRRGALGGSLAPLPGIGACDRWAVRGPQRPVDREQRRAALEEPDRRALRLK